MMAAISPIIGAKSASENMSGAGAPIAAPFCTDFGNRNDACVATIPCPRDPRWPSGGLEGLERGFGLTVEDGQQRSRRRVRLNTILLPVSDRTNRDTKRPGEFGLGHAKLAPDSVDRDDEIELRERRVGIFAILNGVSTDLILGGGSDFDEVDDRLCRSQIV